MSKKITHLLDVVVEMKDGTEIVETYNEVSAKERFTFLVRLALEVGFERVRSIRLVGARRHVLFEYRDIRSFVNQQTLLDYGQKA